MDSIMKVYTEISNLTNKTLFSDTFPEASKNFYVSHLKFQLIKNMKTKKLQ